VDSRSVMTHKPVVVTVLVLKPGFGELLLPELAPIIEASRLVTGCLVFDLYRLSEDRSTLVLHEIWETRDALDAYALNPLRSEMTSLVSRFLAQPLRSWSVEEVC
jgi:quinol monooxygenase YgiN